MMSRNYDDIEEKKTTFNSETSDEDEVDKVSGSTNFTRSSTLASLSESEDKWPSCLEIEEIDEGWVVFSRTSSSISSISSSPSNGAHVHRQGQQPGILEWLKKLFKPIRREKKLFKPPRRRDRRCKLQFPPYTLRLCSNSSSFSHLPGDEYGGGAEEAERTHNLAPFDLNNFLSESYGTARKVDLKDGTTVAVIRLKGVVVSKREFEQQMEIIEKVGRLPSVVRLRAYYYTKDEQFLVYDYIRAMTLSSLLHVSFPQSHFRNRTLVDWDSRLKIAIGVSRGLAKLHSEGGSKFTHGNIKSDNVLITEELDVYISDFGLASLLIENEKLSQEYDVYRFGVILLELLTRKPVPEGWDLESSVYNVIPQEWTENFDAELMTYPNTRKEDMVGMVQIAIACIARSPDERPKMDEVARMIADLRKSDSENMPS